MDLIFILFQVLITLLLHFF